VKEVTDILGSALNAPGFMFQNTPTRRRLLALGASAPLSLLGATAAAASTDYRFKDLASTSLHDEGHIRYGHLNFEDAAEKMHAKVKLEFGTDNGTYVWWYSFVLFAVTQKRSPVRLVRFEGMEMSEWRKSAENEYIVHGHNVSFPQDYETGAYLSSWENPLTGQTVQAQPTLLTSDPGRRKTPVGDYDLSDGNQTLRPENSVLRVEGDLVHKDDVRNPPEDWPGQFVETNTVTGSLVDLNDGNLTSAPARGSGMWVQPFLKWMGMPKDSGHMVGYFSGRKIPSVDVLPKPFYGRLISDHKELASVDPTKFSGEYWKKNKSGLLNVD